MNTTILEILGRPVVAADTAGNVGEVKAVVLSDDASAIVRLHVAGRKRSAELVEWSEVTSVGTDAVMIASESSLQDPVDDVDEAYVRGDVDAIGARILNVSGYEQGEVSDVRFDAESGAVIEALSLAGPIDASQIRSLGSYALIVA